MKRVLSCFVLGLAVLFYCSDVLAQPVTGKVSEHMKNFNWMVGDWRGEAWYLGREQKKIMIVQNEHIITRLDGALITMEGSGYDKPTGADNAKLVFQAFGILTYDISGSKFTLRAYQGENFIDSDLVSNPYGSYTWSFEDSNGKTRYTITHTAEGKWNERGEQSRDGIAWNQFFEMTLNKQ